MSCAIGYDFTVCLSDEGIIHAFGSNSYGQLGLGYVGQIDSVPTLPCPILNLPRIKMVSCGGYFTVCVDYEGFVWSFGDNSQGQLGIDEDRIFCSPQKIEDIPPVQSVSCGRQHTLIIANDYLWACGNNERGQLCLGSKERKMKFTQSSFSEIKKICAGGYHSLFQNSEGDIYGCGSNKFGFGCTSSNPQFDVVCAVSHNQLPNPIIQFSCGSRHSLFLDSAGCVYSVGFNMHGCLGLGNDKSTHELTRISKIPAIHKISCSAYCSYLIDFEGNLWSFGVNNTGQLGFGDTVHRAVPTKTALTDIQQISSGCFSDGGSHCLVRDYQGSIFAMGQNSKGQLRPCDDKQFRTPVKIDECEIWGEETQYSRVKSARK